MITFTSLFFIPLKQIESLNAMLAWLVKTIFFLLILFSTKIPQMFLAKVFVSVASVAGFKVF